MWTNLQNDLYELLLTHSCPELNFEIITFTVFKAATQKQQFIVYLNAIILTQSAKPELIYNG
jgi:hypothetical protein